MQGIHSVPIRQVPLARLTPVIGEDRAAALQDMARVAREELGGARVWTVALDQPAGGVSELIRALMGYTLDAGVDAHWCALSADPMFAATIKSLHYQLHGFPGHGEPAGAEAGHYAAVTDFAGAELAEAVRPGEVVLLHDAATAGLTPRLARAGAHVIWRCHVGAEHTNEHTDEAWRFLQPHLEQCQAFIFSRRAYAPKWLPDNAVVVIPPSIDPYSPKNEELSAADIAAVLRDAGILSRRGSRKRFSRRDGTPTAISRPVHVVREGYPLDASVPVVLQVSRWDHLKDMAGVMAGFVEAVASDSGAHLLLAGPAPGGDHDPEAAEVFADCTEAWRSLPMESRRRVTLVCIPTHDPDENALVVNALQRHAKVIVQKSLAEGFGLTVAEGMWKARPVVASAVGGIPDQIAPGTGILLEDPTDARACGREIARLLSDPELSASLGEAARARVVEEFVGDQHLAAYAQLMGKLHLRPR